MKADSRKAANTVSPKARISSMEILIEPRSSLQPKIVLPIDSTESNNPIYSSERLTQKKIAANTSNR
jgi:hypothetical protein